MHIRTREREREGEEKRKENSGKFGIDYIVYIYNYVSMKRRIKTKGNDNVRNPATATTKAGGKRIYVIIVTSNGVRYA